MDNVTVYMETVYNSSNSTNSTRNLNKNRKMSIMCEQSQHGFWNMAPNQFMHQNQILDGLRRSSWIIHQIKIFTVNMDGLKRPGMEPCRNSSNFCLIQGILQWRSILEHTQMTKSFDTKKYCIIIFYINEVGLHWNFPIIPKDAPDVQFSNRKWVLTTCTTRNL